MEEGTNLDFNPTPNPTTTDFRVITTVPSKFLTISIAHHQKIRIKIPKTFVRSVQRRSSSRRLDHDFSDDQSKNDVTRGDCKSRKVSQNRSGLIFSVVLRRKKTLGETCSSYSKDSNGGLDLINEVNKNADDLEAAKKKRRTNYKRRKLSSFRRFFIRKRGFTLFRGRSKIDNNKKSNLDAVNTTKELSRVPTKILTIRSRKLKIDWSVRMKSTGRVDKELCKKRILMGEKCKPLNHSGKLAYDKNGILLPEEIS